MAYVRVIDPIHFDRVRGRFQDFAFKPSSTDRAISVVDDQCARAASGSICGHIDALYRGLVGGGRAAVFWFVPPLADLPGDPQLTPDDTDGDDCHYLLTGISATAAKRFFLQWQTTNGFAGFHACDGTLSEPFSPDLISELLEQFPK